MVRSEPRGVEETTPTLTFGQMATLRGYASKLRKLRDPMREHSTEYVINMWKVYNHLHLGGRNSAQILNLLTYVAYVYFLTYLLAHLPPPATMLRHAEAVSDLLLGEEFDQQTTHIYKSWYDVMTEQEMWEWAYGPLAAAVGGTHGKVDALMGTNWLLGPVRIRQERSEETNRTDCMEALEGVFGARVTEQLHKRGVECTSNWANGANRADFLDFSQPLSSLGLCSDACAADAGCESIVDCTEWNGDEDGCIKAIGCAFRKRSFVQAFPNWWQQQQTGNCPASSADSEGRCKGAHCCSLRRCYKDRDDQEQAIGGVHDEKDIGKEHACSMRRSAANLTWNPSGSYRSHVRMDSTTSESLWGVMQHVGDGGYHIDLPGDSETLIMMLKGLQQLGFVDQLTRSVDFQLILINGNRFSVPDRTMVSTTMEHASKYHPIVMVNVELNFMFSPSGFLSKYDRINAIQLRPLQFIYVEDENNKSFVTLLKVRRQDQCR